MHLQMQDVPPDRLSMQESALPKLCFAPRPLYFRTFRSKSSLIAVEEVVTSDTAAVAHSAEDASLVVQIDGRIKLCYIALVHDKNSVVPV